MVRYSILKISFILFGYLDGGHIYSGANVANKGEELLP